MDENRYPAVPIDQTQPFSEMKITSRGYLPHWEMEGSIYFITYRLADSLPRQFMEELQRKHADYEAVLKNRSSTASRERDSLKITKAIEQCLNRGFGSCVFARDDIAAIVAGNLNHFDGSRYRLLSWCIMPNHVHVIIRPTHGNRLATIIQSWKSYTSHEINKKLGRSGRLWQPERYDRLIRDEIELRNACEYVVNNPLKAGLEDWKWVWCFYTEASVGGNRILE